jgi:hypothetical protein
VTNNGKDVCESDKPGLEMALRERQRSAINAMNGPEQHQKR